MPPVVKLLRGIWQKVERILPDRSCEFRILIFHRAEGTRGSLCFRRCTRLHTPPTALLLDLVPEFGAVLCVDRTGMMRQRRECRLQHFFITLPWQGFVQPPAQAMS